MSFSYQPVPNSMSPLLQGLGIGPQILPPPPPPPPPHSNGTAYINPVMATQQLPVPGLNDAPLEFKTNLSQNSPTASNSDSTSNSSPLKLPLTNSSNKVEKIAPDSTSSILKNIPSPNITRYPTVATQPNLMGNLLGMNFPFMGMNMFGIEPPPNLFSMNNYGFGLSATPTGTLQSPAHIVERDLDIQKNQVVANISSQETILLKSCTLFIPAVKSPSMAVTREKPLGCKTIFVKGLPEKMTEDILMEIFERCGEIQSLRFCKRSFCHIRFVNEFAVDAAILLTGYKVRIGQSSDNASNGRLYIDYAQTREDKYDYECKQRQLQRELRHREKLEEKYLRPLSPNSIVPYTDHEATIISEKVKHDTSFLKAIQVIIMWLERGDCSKKNANVFYSMIQSTNSHVRRLLNEKVQFEEEFQKSKNLLKSRIHAIFTQFNQVEKVFSAASHKKVWDHFTKAQRKNIDIWKKQCIELKATQTDEFFGSNNESKKNDNDNSDSDDEEMSISDSSDTPINTRKRRRKNFCSLENKELNRRTSTHKERLKEENESLQSQLSLAQIQMEKLQYQLLHQNEPNQLDVSNNCDIQLIRRDSEAKILCLLAILLNVHPNGLEVNNLKSYLENSCQLSLPNCDLIEIVLNKFNNLFAKNDEDDKWKFIGLYQTK